MFNFQALKLKGKNSDLFTSAQSAALIAGDILKKYQNGFLKIYTKEDNSPVTHADLEAQKVISLELDKTGIPVLGEENLPDEDFEVPSLFWLVDPLDGTKGYIRGSAEFTINIALVHYGHPIFGLIYAPVKSKLFAGLVNQGALVMRTDQNVSPTYILPRKSFQENDPDPILITSNQEGLGTTWVLQVRQSFKERNKNIQVIHGKSALKFGWLIEGEVHLYYRTSPCSTWDLAAGQALLESVGGAIVWKELDKTTLYTDALLKDVPVPFWAYANPKIYEILDSCLLTIS